MNWLSELFLGTSVAHSVLILAMVITLGILLSRIKIGGISLGITWILFVGIAAGHFGLTLEPHLLHFVKEFGLIIFVYSVGLQVGPGFFSSFKKGGVTLNMLATLIVLLGCVTAYIIHLVSGTSLVTMVGVLYGAVTNTPGLGAAQQTFADNMGGASDPSIAMGYAVAYPLGVVGIILTIVSIKFLFRMKLEKENVKEESADTSKMAVKYSILVKNQAVENKCIKDLHDLVDKDFVVSRLCRENGNIEIPTSGTRLHIGDKLLIISQGQVEESLVTFFGELLDDMNFSMWEDMESQLVTRKIIITKPNVNGKTLEELKIRSVFGVNITRVTRAGIDLVAAGDLELQIGDSVRVVGEEKSIEGLAKVLGNSAKQLSQPNLIGIFLGIAVGVFFGSIPFLLPGMPQPVKLGLAGGPLIIAILISRFGYKFKVVTYTTLSANMMLREIGISLFLAAVGIGAGDGFVDTIVNKGGVAWVGYGVIITVVPLLIVAAIGRFVYHLNYYTLMGLIAGSTTDPPALAYANAVSPNNYQAVSYATVYPLSMFLRVLTAQILMLMAL